MTLLRESFDLALHSVSETSNAISSASSDGKLYTIGMLPEDIVNHLAQKLDLVSIGRTGLVARGWMRKIWGFQQELIFSRDKRNPIVEGLRLSACPTFCAWPRPPPSSIVGYGPGTTGVFDPRRITDYMRIRGLAGVEGVFEDKNIEAVVSAALAANVRYLKQLRSLDASAYVQQEIIDEIKIKCSTTLQSVIENTKSPSGSPGMQHAPVARAPTVAFAPQLRPHKGLTQSSKLIQLCKINLDSEGRRAATQLAHEVEHDELALALFEVARRPRSKLLVLLLDVYSNIHSAHRIHMLRNTDGVTLLMIAVQSGADINVNILLKTVAEAVGSDVKRHWLDEGDIWGNTALHYACSISSGPIVALLLSNGADSNLRNIRGEKPIHFAQSRNVMKILLDPQELAQVSPTLSSSQPASGSSSSSSPTTSSATAHPLSSSSNDVASNSSSSASRRSISPGKSRNSKRLGQRPNKPKITIVEACDVDAPYDGALLHRACTMGEDGHFLLQYLLPHLEPRHIVSRDPFGFTPLHLAASAVGRNSVSPILHTILKSARDNKIPLDLDLRVGSGNKPRPLWCRSLVSPCEGMTALHLAAANYGTANIESLLKSGADPDAPLPEGSKWGSHSIELVWTRLDSFYDKSIDYEMINAKVCQVATLLMEHSERAAEFAYRYDWRPQHRSVDPSPQLNMEVVILNILRKINPSNEKISTIAVDRLLTVMCAPLSTDPVLDTSDLNREPLSMWTLRFSSAEFASRVLCAVIAQIPPSGEREDIIEKLLCLDVSPTLQVNTTRLFDAVKKDTNNEVDDYYGEDVFESALEFAKRIGDKKALKQIKRHLAELKEGPGAAAASQSLSSSPPDKAPRNHPDKCIVM